jgi:hypothetical protein
MLHCTASPRAGAGVPGAISGRASAGIPDPLSIERAASNVHLWQIFRQHRPVFLVATGVIGGFRGAPRPMLTLGTPVAPLSHGR